MTRLHLAVPVVVALTAWSSNASAVCPEPFKPLATGTCVAMPSTVAADTPVVVFLHGMAPNPEAALGNAEALGRSATEAGVVVVAPLGTVGLCSWSPEAAKSWCWPSHPRQAPETHAVAERLGKDLKEVASLLGRGGDVRPVLAGFSNGGFGAALLLTAGGFEPAGLAILHAGGPNPWPSRKPIPTLLLTASGDRWHHSTMVELRNRLASAGWGVEWQERDGGHEVTANDIAVILVFTRKVSAPAAAAK